MTDPTTQTSVLNDPPDELAEVPAIVQRAIQTVKLTCQATHGDDQFPGFQNVLILISTTEAGYSFGTGLCSCAGCIGNLRSTFEAWADRISGTDDASQPAQVH